MPVLPELVPGAIFTLHICAAVVDHDVSKRDNASLLERGSEVLQLLLVAVWRF